MRIDALQARALHAWGVGYVVRRIDNSFGQNPDATTENEVRTLDEQGVGVLLYYQRAESAEYATRDQGIEDGGFVLACARIVGYNVGTPVLFPHGTEAYIGGLREAMGDYHPIVIVGSELTVKEVPNGSTREVRDLVQMA